MKNARKGIILAGG
jgi:glucose-1-phosphate thymidylyltransferase